MASPEYRGKYDGWQQGCLVVIGLLAALAVIWFVVPKLWTPPAPNIAPDNNKINISQGSQNKILHETDKESQ